MPCCYLLQMRLALVTGERGDEDDRSSARDEAAEETKRTEAALYGARANYIYKASDNSSLRFIHY